MQMNLLHEGLPEGGRKALATFIPPWIERPEVLGVLLAGSYASGLANDFSDIDLYFVLSDDSTTRQRGNHLIDGWVVEYNADPVRYIRALQEEQHKVGRLHCARKICTSKVIFDRGQLAQLREEARATMQRPFALKDHANVEMMKYYLWDQLDNLRDLASRAAPGYLYAYHCGLQMLINFYAEYLGAEVLRPVRMYEFLNDENFRLKEKIGG